MVIRTAGTFTPEPEPKRAKLLGSLGCYRYNLKVPLEYKVVPVVERDTRNKVIVYTESPITLHGYGSTESEALDDLRASIIDLLHSLQAHKYQLGKEPKRELRWLEKNIKIKWFDH